jgi:hypothetical protein
MTWVFCGLCSLVLGLGMFLIVFSIVQCQENMNKWLWNAVTLYHECSVVYPNLYCWDQRNIKKTWWKQKLRFVDIMQFPEVPWNCPWALWEGYCESAMQHTTLNSELWELQTAFTVSLMYLFYSLHTNRYQLHMVTSHKEAKYKYAPSTMIHISLLVFS